MDTDEHVSHLALKFDGKELHIFVDAIDVRERVRTIESRYGTKLAGRYRGLTGSEIISHIDDLCGYDRYGVYIYGCDSCGELGCWPIEVKIRRMQQFITWSSFNQFISCSSACAPIHPQTLLIPAMLPDVLPKFYLLSKRHAVRSRIGRAGSALSRDGIPHALRQTQRICLHLRSPCSRSYLIQCA